MCSLQVGGNGLVNDSVVRCLFIDSKASLNELVTDYDGLGCGGDDI